MSGLVALAWALGAGAIAVLMVAALLRPDNF